MLIATLLVRKKEVTCMADDNKNDKLEEKAPQSGQVEVEKEKTVTKPESPLSRKPGQNYSSAKFKK
jgi:hypothetical protein